MRKAAVANLAKLKGAVRFLKHGGKDIEPEKTASTYLGRDLMQGQKAFEERQKAAREAGTLKFDYDKKKKFGQK